MASMEDRLFPGEHTEVAADAVHVPDRLDEAGRRERIAERIEERIEACRQWARGGRRAVTDALGPAAAVAAANDIALVNFYDGDPRVGMHRDTDIKPDAPAVSSGPGDTSGFRFGFTATRTRRPGRGRTRTSSCAAATCSSSAGPPGSPTTGCHACIRARHRPGWG
jgi:hypothetical protein